MPTRYRTEYRLQPVRVKREVRPNGIKSATVKAGGWTVRVTINARRDAITVRGHHRTHGIPVFSGANIRGGMVAVADAAAHFFESLTPDVLLWQAVQDATRKTIERAYEHES